MTRVHIDISVFTPQSSVGVISGALEVGELPQVGQFISFLDPPTPRSSRDVPEQGLRLQVEHVLAAPDGSDKEALVMLSDMNLATREDAGKVVAYLQDGFGLYFDEHDI